MSTYKDHMHQTSKNIKSTKQQEPMRQEELLRTPMVQLNITVFTNIIDYRTGISTDLTGKFPVTSNMVNK